MKIKMKLLSDTIFGNGASVPGAEDISVLSDANGFPYFKGTTFKGIFREELERLLEWSGESNVEDIGNKLLGESGANSFEGKLVFSDFHLSEAVKQQILSEMGENSPADILDVLTNTRTFTKVSEAGVAEEGSLRIARCVNAGLVFYSEISGVEDEKLIEEVVGLIKWVGSMRNRGFGKVCITVEGGRA